MNHKKSYRDGMENIMIKKNLAMAVMLGLCMASLSTAPAYAMLSTSTPASGVSTEQSDALITRQGEIDKLLFEANAKTIEKMGFMVNYTGVVDDHIEIGISPFNDDNANFIYDVVGKDDVKVVEMDQSILYASGAATDVASNDAVASPDTKMYKGDAAGTAEDADLAATSGLAEDNDKEVQIQIESTDTAKDDAVVQDKAATDEKIYMTTSAKDDGIRTISAPAEAPKEEGVATPVVVLAVVGGVALIGGTVLLSNKKKSTK